MAEVRRLAYEVDDRVLHELVDGSPFPDGEVLKRAGYLLRTEPEDRTPTGDLDGGDRG